MSTLRPTLDRFSLDRAPLRRAGLLALLLGVLLAVGTAFGPARAAGLAPSADRQDVQAGPESVSASRASIGWTGGRVLALVLLAAGGGVALVMHRRRSSSGTPSVALIDVIETHPLGPTQTLQLVACGDEVLLLCVGEQTRLLRHWPRASVEAGTADFAAALATASAMPTEDPALANASPPTDAEPDDAAEWLADLIASAPVEAKASARPADAPTPAVTASPASSPCVDAAPVVVVPPPLAGGRAPASGPPAPRALPAPGLRQFGGV